MPGRDQALAAAQAMAEGRFLDQLARLVAVPTESERRERRGMLAHYLSDVLGPLYARLGFALEIFDNPEPAGGPFLLAERVEDAGLPTVLSYGHGDTVAGMEGRWAEGRDPFALTRAGDRLYGRGTADNKGQHLINLLALEAALAARDGKLGFNTTVLIETSEEIGSPGLREFCRAERARLRADMLLASDGPRVAPEMPTLVLGTRGVVNFRLEAALRSKAHHSGNWGGIIADPGVLIAHAIAAILSPEGRIEVPEWRPGGVDPAVLEAFRDAAFDPGDGPDRPDPGWGEPGLSDWQKLGAWTSFSVLALELGTPDAPVNAIQPRAVAHCGLRITPDVDQSALLPALRRYLEARGLGTVKVVADTGGIDFPASRQAPDAPWPRWAAASIARSLGRRPVVLPNAAGSLPNEVFADLLGLPTIWVPHSYSSCGQHAPDEHLLLPVVAEALRLMAGLWWDLGEAEGRPI